MHLHFCREKGTTLSSLSCRLASNCAYPRYLHNNMYTRAPLRGRLALPATLAQGRIQLKVKGAERRGPPFGATSDLIPPRATCAELIALCCAMCLLEMSRSDRQHTGVISEEKKTRLEPREDNHMKKAKRRVSTYIRAPGTSHDNSTRVDEGRKR